MLSLLSYERADTAVCTVNSCSVTAPEKIISPEIYSGVNAYFRQYRRWIPHGAPWMGQPTVHHGASNLLYNQSM